MTSNDVLLLAARLDAIEDHLRDIDAQQTLIMQAVRELGQQVALMLESHRRDSLTE